MIDLLYVLIFLLGFVCILFGLGQFIGLGYAGVLIDIITRSFTGNYDEQNTKPFHGKHATVYGMISLLLGVTCFIFLFAVLK